MIINDKKQTSTSTIQGESAEFRIATNAKAFRVLVDGIYSDKVGSIVRELMSNAWDAHVRRGVLDLPFEVRLPSALNPTFSVRDYGCSMDHEFVMRSYSTLFESSKSNSNTEVGAFGLGAKSFLAYTDACTLTCWLDGEVRSYSIALSDNGVPEVKLVHKAPSTEPQGVEVTFAVAQGDFNWFKRSADLCAYGYDVMPKFVGTEITPLTPAHKGNGWRMYSQRVPGMDTNVIVRQGCAVYPTHRYNYNVNLPYGMSIIVDAPIGSVGVTASRESLALNGEQERALVVLVNNAVEELNEQVRAEYRALTTPIARAKFAYENRELLGKGEWPTHVKLPFSVNKWSASGLDPYDTFNVQYLDRITVVFDNGVKIPRRILRLRALARHRSVYLMDDASQLSQMMKLLDLRQDQIVHIDKLPDVQIARTGNNGNGAQKKVITSDVVWAYASRNDAQAGCLVWNRRTDHFGNLYHGNLAFASKAIHDAGNGKPILYLTEREAEAALKSGKIVEDMRLDKVIERALKAAAPSKDLYAQFVRNGINRQVHETFTRAEMIKRSGVKSNVEVPYSDLFSKFFPEAYQKIQAKAHTKVRELAAQFPLLFGFDRKAAEDYIKMCETTGRNG